VAGDLRFYVKGDWSTRLAADVRRNRSLDRGEYITYPEDLDAFEPG